MSKKIRAKMYVSSVRETAPFAGSDTQIDVVLHAVTAHQTPENAAWSKYTPSARLEMTITNPDVAGFFKTGQEVYVDFTPAFAPEGS